MKTNKCKIKELLNIMIINNLMNKIKFNLKIKNNLVLNKCGIK